MISYILRRIAASLVLMIAMTFITFWLLSFSFESIVQNLAGPGATEETLDGLRAAKGFDQPLVVQYFHWLSSAFRGDFGLSYFGSEPVGPAVMQRLGVTLSIVFVALTLTAIASVSLGVWAASRGGVVDKIAQGISLIGYVVPGLLLAIALVIVFAINLKWLPATGFTPPGEDLRKWALGIVIPVIVLVIASVASMAQQVRGAMIDELQKDYVRTLRTRGLSSRSIVLKHALRSAASPALTVLGFEFGTMLGGALIIEKVFAIPGFGTFAFNSSVQSDIPVIMGIAAFGVFLTVGVNLTIDIVNGWLNPKARLY